MNAPSSVGKFTPEGVLARLREEGLRITSGRKRILAALFQAREPLSLQEIQAAAKSSRGEQPDYATVFRMIALLERLHIVHKVNLQRSCSYFELCDPNRHYDHIVCTACGKVVLINEPCPLGGIEARIAEKYGFQNLTHSLEFFGRCADCGARTSNSDL
jgi:Fur family transcriptional regulator, ferric uptake regulator